jgi:hypothetical protein
MTKLSWLFPFHFPRIYLDSCRSFGLQCLKRLSKSAHFFSLRVIILSTHTRHANSKSTSSVFLDNKIHRITRGLIKWFISSIGRRRKQHPHLHLTSSMPAMPYYRSGN